MTVPTSHAARHVLCRHPGLRRHTLIRIMGVLNLWKCGNGLDSLDIATQLGLPESDVCTVIGCDRERRLRRHSSAA